MYILEQEHQIHSILPGFHRRPGTIEMTTACGYFLASLAATTTANTNCWVSSLPIYLVKVLIPNIHNGSLIFSHFNKAAPKCFKKTFLKFLRRFKPKKKCFARSIARFLIVKTCVNSTGRTAEWIFMIILQSEDTTKSIAQM